MSFRLSGKESTPLSSKSNIKWLSRISRKKPVHSKCTLSWELWHPDIWVHKNTCILFSLTVFFILSSSRSPSLVDSCYFSISHPFTFYVYMVPAIGNWLAMEVNDSFDLDSGWNTLNIQNLPDFACGIIHGKAS
jgi:hypothetical protein